MRIAWQGQLIHLFLRHRQRDQHLGDVAVTPGMRQPQVPGPKGVAQMEKNGHFPKSAVPGLLRLEVSVPFGIGAEKIDARLSR